MVHIMSERLQAVIAVIQELQDKSNNLNFRRIFGYMKPHRRGDSGGYLCSHVQCDIILSIRWKLKSNSSPFWKTAVRLASPFPFLFSAVSSALQPAQRAMNNSGWLWPGQRPLNTQVCLLTSSLLPSTLVSHCSLLRCDSQFDINHLLAILPLAQAPCWSSCLSLLDTSGYVVFPGPCLPLLFLLSLDISTWTAIIHFLPLHPFILFTSVPPCLPLELKGAATQAAWNLK